MRRTIFIAETVPAGRPARAGTTPRSPPCRPGVLHTGRPVAVIAACRSEHGPTPSVAAQAHSRSDRLRDRDGHTETVAGRPHPARHRTAHIVWIGRSTRPPPAPDRADCSAMPSAIHASGPRRSAGPLAPAPARTPGE